MRTVLADSRSNLVRGETGDIIVKCLYALEKGLRTFQHAHLNAPWANAYRLSRAI